SSAGLAPYIKEPPLVGQENFARIEVLQAAKFFSPAINADHSAVRNEQAAKFSRINKPASIRFQHGLCAPRLSSEGESGCVHVRLLPASGVTACQRGELYAGLTSQRNPPFASTCRKYRYVKGLATMRKQPLVKIAGSRAVSRRPDADRNPVKMAR